MLRGKDDSPISVEDFMPMTVLEWRKSVDSLSDGGDIRRDEPQLPASIAIFEEMLQEHVNRS